MTILARGSNGSYKIIENKKEENLFRILAFEFEYGLYLTPVGGSAGQSCAFIGINSVEKC